MLPSWCEAKAKITLQALLLMLVGEKLLGEARFQHHFNAEWRHSQPWCAKALLWRSLLCKSAPNDTGLSLECVLWKSVPDVRNVFQMFWPPCRWTPCSALRWLPCSEGGLKVLLKQFLQSPALFCYSFVPACARVTLLLVGEVVRCLRHLERTRLGSRSRAGGAVQWQLGLIHLVGAAAQTHTVMPSTLGTAIFKFNLELAARNGSGQTTVRLK